MSIFISLSVIFWSLFPSLLSYTQNSPEPNKVHLQNIISNSHFDDTNGWVAYRSTISSINNTLKITGNVEQITALAYCNIPFNVGDVVYYRATLWTPDTTTSIGVSVNGYRSQANANSAVVNTKYNLSGIWTLAGVTPNRFELFITNTITQTINGLSLYAEKPIYYNVSQMIANGVKDDNGTLFSSLTNQQIKTQLDTWVDEIPMGYYDSYYYSTSINDDYKWFSTGFVDKTGERDFLDYLGFFVWLAVPPISIYLLYKLMKGLIYE